MAAVPTRPKIDGDVWIIGEILSGFPQTFEILQAVSTSVLTGGPPEASGGTVPLPASPTHTCVCWVRDPARICVIYVKPSLLKPRVLFLNTHLWIFKGTRCFSEALKLLQVPARSRWPVC